MNGVVGASGLCYDSAITKEDVNETKNCTLKCFNGTTHLLRSMKTAAVLIEGVGGGGYMLCFSVATAGAFGSSSVLAPRELAIHGKKNKKETLMPWG